MKLNKINGMPVKDAKKPIRITVTKSNCAHGTMKDAASCPAALALKKVPGCAEARVHIGRTYLRFGKVWLKYKTPLPLKIELVSFDRGGYFQPGDYILRPLSEAERRRYKPRGPHIASGKRRLAHIIRDVRPHGANR